MTVTHLNEYLEQSAARWPDRAAVVDPAGWEISYAELNRRADAFAEFLAARGVRHGDRVGVVLPKSVASLVAFFGTMKAGAAYVPVDCTAPSERGQRILTDCQVRAVVVDDRSAEAAPDDETVVVVRFGPELTPSSDRGPSAKPAEPAPPTPRRLEDLAYILYTSGSTGMPKGVMLTHENAVSFVDWCSSVFDPTDTDRFSSHAPFHFDLSILDIYVSIKHGATLFLISEDLGKNPKELARFIGTHRLTVWYSTPSILTLLMQYGNLEAIDASSLRLVLFAGEVFPVKHLREVQRRWPAPVYYNLYGPTETNVCTFARIPADIPADRDTPYPIGFACDHCTALVLEEDGYEVASGEEGLLYMSGPSVFQGYWNRPEVNRTLLLERDGRRWYNTGDLVRWDPADGYVYLGRRDRMVKRRGYRIELGEIERALYLHPRVREAAVISTSYQDGGVRIVACVSCHDEANPSVIEMKTFCASHLPVYMSPDRFLFLPRLPRTSTNKVDYQTLRQDSGV